MSPTQHTHVHHTLRIKSVLRWIFCIWGVVLTVIVLWPLVFSGDTSHLERTIHTDVNTLVQQERSKVPQKTASIQSNTPKKSRLTGVTLEDADTQKSITAQHVEHHTDHMRLDKAKITSNADTSVLQADTADLNNTDKTVNAKGNVFYRDKNGIEIASDSLYLKQDDKVIANGNVVITSDNVQAKSKTATYTEKNGILHMQGGVIIEVQD